MKFVDRVELRVAVLKYLRLKYGIQLKKRMYERFERNTVTARPQVKLKVFGVPLKHLPLRNTAEFGLVPCFLVDSCQHLLNHVDSEGLFRKSGSIVRLKALRARLDIGEYCLSTALPCDVTSLVKQFFYELPSPVIPDVLALAFTAAQRLPTEEERTAATLLVSCLLPEMNLSTLHFFFIFLKQVSLRSSENKMDSYNLAVVITPNLFHLQSASDLNDECLRLHIAVICTLIENAHNFGVVPDTVLVNGPFILDSPLPREVKPLSNFEQKSKGRRDSEVSSLHTAGTPGLKKKTVSDSAGDEFPHRKRKSFRRSLGMVPSVLFGRCYDSSSKKQDSSPSALLNRRLSNSTRREGCARVCKKVKRAVSDAFRCVTSSPGDKTPPESPVASCWPQPYQDTPVGRCLKKQYSEHVSAPNKLLANNVLRTLCCTSATDSPEDKRFLTQDSVCSSVSASMCLENETSTLKKHSSTTSGLEVQNTHGGGDAEQKQIWKKKDFIIVQHPDPKLLDNLDLLSSSSAPLIEHECNMDTSLEVQSETLDEANTTKRNNVHDSRFFNVRDCTSASAFKSSPLIVQNLSIPASSRHGAVTKNTSTCSNHLKGWSGPKPLNTPNSPKVSVVERVRKYDGLQVKSALRKVTQSPLKFHRTPVYQYVKRINSRIKRVQVIK